MSKVCHHCNNVFQANGKHAKVCDTCRNKNESAGHARGAVSLQLNAAHDMIDKIIEQGAPKSSQQLSQ